MDASPPSDQLLLRKDLGAYRLEALLGQGGMAHVYRARERATGHVVAIKVLIETKAPNPSMRERFDREWRMMQAITHPNVVAVLDWPDDPLGPLYYVMELLEGETLAQRLERDERLPVALAIEVFVQIAEGLAAVHVAKSVHRDIKPQNIFLTTRKDGRLSVKILDFGLARVFGSQITGSGVIVGTPAYVSPEQASGDRVDQRTDIYALGLVMYRVLTGQHPFTSEDQVTTIGHQILSVPPPLSWLEESVPRALEALVLKMLRKRPEDRPQTIAEVLTALSMIERVEASQSDRPSADPTSAGGPMDRPSNPPDDSYGPLNPLAESLVKNALIAKGFRRPRS